MTPRGARLALRAELRLAFREERQLASAFHRVQRHGDAVVEHALASRLHGAMIRCFALRRRLQSLAGPQLVDGNAEA
jgi:hypothetical protein